MIPLLVLAMAALGPGGPGSIPDNRGILRDVSSPTPVTDKDLRPVKLPDCRSDADVQHTLELLRQGAQGECFVRDIKAFGRR